ncbi:MAG: hypothetical protein JNM57_04430 [Cyclobacteriaceae bacterium]|nr:hypothetical protein [Cyclobacteriaceae bacterium]
MKTTTKILFFIAVSAIVTLSFTFSASTKQNKAIVAEKSAVNDTNEPLGGFVSEDKF